MKFISHPQVARPDRVVFGMGVMSLSVLIFALVNVLVKEATTRYNVVEVAFFRNLFALIPILVILFQQGGVKLLRSKRLPGHFLRSISGLIAMMCLFISFDLMPLADAVALSYATPLFVAILSVFLLGEKIGFYRISAIIVGFIGVLIMVNPGASLWSEPGTLIALSGTLFYALAMISIRSLSQTEHPITIVSWFTLICTIFTALPLPWLWETPTGWDWLILISAGILAGVAQFFMTLAYRFASAIIVTPLNYSGLIWAAGLAWLIWSEVPTLRILLGGAVVMASGVFILYREAYRAQKDRMQSKERQREKAKT